MMIPGRTYLALIAVLALGACTSVGDIPTVRLAEATLVNANGIPAGTAQFLGAGDAITLTIAVSGLAPGQHGVHLHTTGKCEAPAFASAGGHLNPSGHQHGSMNPAGPHLGDLPNLIVGDNGASTITATIPGTRAEIEARLFDDDGTALIVHAGPDDYKTDPSGNSGGRIACGVLIRK